MNIYNTISALFKKRKATITDEVVSQEAIVPKIGKVENFNIIAPRIFGPRLAELGYQLDKIDNSPHGEMLWATYHYYTNPILNLTLRIEQAPYYTDYGFSIFISYIVPQDRKLLCNVPHEFQDKEDDFLISIADDFFANTDVIRMLRGEMWRPINPVRMINHADKMTIICKNCNHRFGGNFCNNCGQTAKTHEINFTSIIHEIQHSILHVDKGILYTSKELFRRPGHTIRDYLNGKRVNHFKPFAYIFILSTVYALLTKISNKTNFLDDFLSGMSASASNKTSKGLGLFGELVQWMANHYAYATLIIIPIISFASYSCFIKTKRNYFQHLILNSFVAGQRTVAYLVMLPFMYFINNQVVNDMVDSLKIVLSICLTFWTYYQFFDTLKPIKRVLLTVLTYIVMIVLFLFVVIVLFVLSKIVAA